MRKTGWGAAVLEDEIFERHGVRIGITPWGRISCLPYDERVVEAVARLMDLPEPSEKADPSGEDTFGGWHWIWREINYSQRDWNLKADAALSALRDTIDT